MSRRPRPWGGPATCPTGKIGHRADGLEVAEHDVIGPDGRPTGARVWVAADGRTFTE